jgi:hypothetical protein
MVHGWPTLKENELALLGKPSNVNRPWVKDGHSWFTSTPYSILECYGLGSIFFRPYSGNCSCYDVRSTAVLSEDTVSNHSSLNSGLAIFLPPPLWCSPILGKAAWYSCSFHMEALPSIYHLNFDQLWIQWATFKSCFRLTSSIVQSMPSKIYLSFKIILTADLFKR